MSMRTRLLLSLALLAIFALFHIAVSVVGAPEDSPLLPWAYWLTAAMFAVQIGTVLLVFRSGNPAEAVFLKTPIAYAGSVWLVAQTALGLAGAYLSFCEPNIFIAICGSAAIVYGIALIFIFLGGKSVTDVGDEAREKTRFIHSLALEIGASGHNHSGDPDVRKSVSALAEKIRYSDPVSSPALAEIEGRIMSAALELKQLDPEGKDAILSAVASMERLLDERNRLCLDKTGRGRQ